MYEIKYKVKISDSDYYEDLKLSSLLRLIQEISILHAEELNIGKSATLDKGIIWVVLKEMFIIKRMPKYNEDIIIKTYPLKTKHHIFPRNYLIYDSNNELLIESSSLWTLVSIKDRKLIEPDEYNIFVEEEDTDFNIDSPRKIEKDNVSFKYDRLIKYSDLDLNLHCNNTNYANYILDIKDKDFYKDHKFSFFEIIYNKELKENETLEIFSNDDLSYIEGLSDNSTIFTAKVIF